MVFIPLSCLAGLQLTPVYFYKHFSFFGFSEKDLFFVFNQSVIQLYSCVSLLYFIQIIKHLFFKKDKIKENQEDLSKEKVIQFFVFTCCIYFVYVFFSFFFIKSNFHFFYGFFNNYFIITYLISFFYFNNFINNKFFTFIYLLCFFF